MGKRVHAQELAEKEEDERLKRMEEAQEKRKSSQTQPSQTQSVYSWMPQLPASAHAPSQAPPSHLAPPRPYQPQPQPHQLPPQARRYSQEPIHGRPRTQYYQPQQQQQQKQYQPSIHESQANRQLQTPAARPVSQSFVLVPATSQAS
ncbi:hypothetical protein GGI11_002939 [Coemansia sp. RSA 2049]|nr:hypothetical protein GGI11_002939 [Coemansia sp. RSA 2049]